MRLLSRTLLILAAMTVIPTSAMADNWVFARSYYTHKPFERVEIGTPTSSRSIAPQYFRAYVQGGFRYTGGSYNLRSNNFGYGRYFESWQTVGPHN